MDFVIRKGKPEEIPELVNKIPEFEPARPPEYYLERLSGRNFLILVANVENRIAGFKIGYDRYQNGSFYSWLGGVVPEFRRSGIATALSERFEQWVWKRGYLRIVLKTRYKFKSMIRMLQSRNYRFTGFRLEPDRFESRLIFIKQSQ